MYVRLVAVEGLVTIQAQIEVDDHNEGSSGPFESWRQTDAQHEMAPWFKDRLSWIQELGTSWMLATSPRSLKTMLQHSDPTLSEFAAGFETHNIGDHVKTHDEVVEKLTEVNAYLARAAFLLELKWDARRVATDRKGVKPKDTPF